MNIINDHDWEDLGRKFKSAKPFPSICIDNFLVPEFADKLAASYPQYDDARPLGREFSSLNENLKIQITEPEKFPEAVISLSAALAEDDFLQKLSGLSGINNLVWDPAFSGGGMHLTKSSGLLDVHVDFNFEEELDLYRRLNILIYLNPVWKKEWGGDVELWDKEVKNCIHSFEPIHNRCVLFATSDYSFHGVKSVQTPDGVSRNSFAAYFYSAEAGDNAGEPYGGNHTTIFKARPEERVKKYWSMPIKKAAGALDGYKSAIKSKLKKLVG